MYIDKTVQLGILLYSSTIAFPIDFGAMPTVPYIHKAKRPQTVLGTASSATATQKGPRQPILVQGPRGAMVGRPTVPNSDDPVPLYVIVWSTE